SHFRFSPLPLLFDGPAAPVLSPLSLHTLFRSHLVAAAPVQVQAALVVAEVLDGDLGGGAVDLDPVAVRTGLADRERIGPAQVGQFGDPADVVVGPGPPAACGG